MLDERMFHGSPAKKHQTPLRRFGNANHKRPRSQPQSSTSPPPTTLSRLPSSTPHNHTMPPARLLTTGLRASKSLVKPSSQTVRALSQSSAKRAADHAHEDHYDPPSGWLFGVKPGEKAEKEGWEGIWIYGFFGSLGLAVVGYAFKPDTS
jgi:hypothetical protein